MGVPKEFDKINRYSKYLRVPCPRSSQFTIFRGTLYKKCVYCLAMNVPSEVRAEAFLRFHSSMSLEFMNQSVNSSPACCQM